MIAHCTDYSHTAAFSTVMHGISRFPKWSCACYRATSFTGLAELVASDRTIVQADNPINLSRYLDLAVEALYAWLDASLHHAPAEPLHSEWRMQGLPETRAEMCCRFLPMVCATVYAESSGKCNM